MSRISSPFLVLVCALFVTACGTYTSLLGTWTKPEYVNKQYKKVLVFATGTKTLVNQSVVERAVAVRLAAGGTMAVPASDIFPRTSYDANGDGKIDDPSIAGKLAATLKEQGYDAVLVFGIRDVKEQERYVPGTVTYQPSPNYGYGYNNGWSNYWANSYHTIETPGYYTTDVEAYVEANMFDVAKGELVWSAQTETLNPVAISDASESFADVLAPAIMKSGLVLVK